MTKFQIQRPVPGEYNPYYDRYISLVPDGDLLELLQRQGGETVTLLRDISEEQSRFAYAPGKWTIREVLGHLTDAERVFTYRALTFARGDTAALPSFEENAWAEVSNATHRSIQDHIDDFIAVRAATLALFRGFTPADFARAGTASGNHITVRALAYITAGHERHHTQVLRERYLA
jgi:uncharacterized damage-inducible protein DinB